MPSLSGFSRLHDTDVLQFLADLDISAMKLGLDRIRALLETVGNPQDQLPMVHIAGTNGKGSVTAMLSAILKASGYRVGSFTSPHLIHVEERIAINGNPILPDDFQAEVASLKAHLESLHWSRENWPTYFEALNLVAYQYFKRENVDITVFETGLGGRLDSTNVVRQPNLTVITTIGMDHMHHLGNTLAAIAAEKAGIIKAGVPLVIGPSVPNEALAVIREKAQHLEAPIHQAQSASLKINPEESHPDKGLSIENHKTDQHYRLSLLAPYQKDNLAIILECVHCLREQGLTISEAAVQEGLRHTYWPVRFQYFKKEQLLLDGSHNEDGFRALREGLRMYFPGRSFIWLLSLRNNRPLEPLLDVINTLGPPLAIIITKSEPNHLYHPPATLANQVKKSLRNTCPIVITDTPIEALALLKDFQTQFSEKQPMSIATGSLYTAGALLQQLETSTIPLDSSLSPSV
jgi:dihydrofolate synthase/folylpolyglutamate synthase